jgi:nitrite reductase/ring-hydroxylating ferredoxin subunit
MESLVEAIPLDQLPPGKGKVVRVAGKTVALFNVDGTVYAIDDTCVHAGSSLGAGTFQGKIVTCPGHGLKFDVTTGYVTSSPGYGVPTYPVKVLDGNIMVAIE